MAESIKCCWKLCHMGVSVTAGVCICSRVTAKANKMVHTYILSIQGAKKVRRTGFWDQPPSKQQDIFQALHACSIVWLVHTDECTWPSEDTFENAHSGSVYSGPDIKDCVSALLPYIRIPYNTRNEQNVKTHNSISKTNEAAWDKGSMKHTLHFLHSHKSQEQIEHLPGLWDWHSSTNR